jgi:hypothetical protein
VNLSIRRRRREARFGLDESLGDERNLLQITARIAAWRKSHLLELPRQVIGSHLVTGTSRVAALQFVIGQILHMTPPALGLGGRRDCDRQGREGATKKTLHVSASDQ